VFDAPAVARRRVVDRNQVVMLSRPPRPLVGSVTARGTGPANPRVQHPPVASHIPTSKFGLNIATLWKAITYRGHCYSLIRF
jgi:hypothetical protein